MRITARAGRSRTDCQKSADDEYAAAGDERNPHRDAENHVQHKPCHSARDDTGDRVCRSY